MPGEQWSWIVPEGLWEVVRPLLPPAKVRPQGGGTTNIDDEAVFAAIAYVLVSGCAWRHVPPCFGASKSTVHRRFLIRSRAGVWGRLHQALLDRLADRYLLDLSRAVLDSAHVRAKKGGEHTGPSPADREKPGCRLHVLSDRRGLSLGVDLSAGNVHDSHGLEPMIAGHMRQASGKGPGRRIGKLHADKAYDQPDLRRWLGRQRIRPRIARRGIEPDDRLGRHRWVIERTLAWLTGYRRLALRYERDPRNYLAFLGLAAALTCYKRLIKLTT